MLFIFNDGQITEYNVRRIVFKHIAQGIHHRDGNADIGVLLFEALDDLRQKIGGNAGIGGNAQFTVLFPADGCGGGP